MVLESILNEKIYKIRTLIISLTRSGVLSLYEKFQWLDLFSRERYNLKAWKPLIYINNKKGKNIKQNDKKKGVIKCL